ncbi:hypothetical protein [Geomicrobium sp. JCM 19039]|uniref:hypothetical protein n=1 Tax=Geomicrobium sp. JCM 19039 TaxID=1460636 RepID=UPI00187C2C6F|nr:hypothetical protein [Geomicrobium sp. JCM 19039]
MQHMPQQGYGQQPYPSAEQMNGWHEQNGMRSQAQERIFGGYGPGFGYGPGPYYGGYGGGRFRRIALPLAGLAALSLLF